MYFVNHAGGKILRSTKFCVPHKVLPPTFIIMLNFQFYSVLNFMYSAAKKVLPPKTAHFPRYGPSKMDETALFTKWSVK